MNQFFRQFTFRLAFKAAISQFSWLCVLLLSVFSAPLSLADWQTNMPKGVTDISHEVYGIHMLMFWVCVIIAVIVFTVMLYSMLMHRKSRGAKAHNFHESTLVEIIWTIIPIVILVALAFPAAKTLSKIYDRQPADISILITGYQWKWHYDYLETGSSELFSAESNSSNQTTEKIEFFSLLATDRAELTAPLSQKGVNYLLEVDKPMVIPVGKRVRLLFTSNDVIHSWWSPDLAVKKDAVPGIVNESWTVVNHIGVYRGQCTELCGKDHGFMPIEVHVVSVEDYQIWLNQQYKDIAFQKALAQKDMPLDELIERGEAVYQANCAACHQLNGQGIAGAFPALDGSPLIMNSVEDHIGIVINGKTGSSMPAFGKQLSDLDLAAVITYERNAWSNQTGDKVSVVDILKSKNKGDVQ
jgi:cytochrome c oxidase subunit II